MNEAFVLGLKSKMKYDEEKRKIKQPKYNTAMSEDAEDILNKNLEEVKDTWPVFQLTDHENAVLKSLDEYWNIAIDRCIVVATNYYREIKPYTRSGVPYISEPHFNQLISKLEQLKKPLQ